MVQNSKEENQYLIMSKVILDNLPSRFREYFDKRIVGKPLSDEIYNNMKEWFFSKIDENIGMEVTLLNIIYFIIETSSLENGDANESYKSYLTNKRNRKNYIFNSIRKEYTGKPTPDDPLFLKNKCEQYFDLMSVSEEMVHYDSKQDYIDMLFKLITEWKSNPESYLFDYMFFEKFDTKRKCACFLVDLGTTIFKIINDQFYGRINGSITSIPSDFLNGLFTLRNETLDLVIEITDEQAVSKKESIIENEDGSTVVINTIYSKHLEDFSELNNDEKNAMVKRLIANNELSTTAESLSPRELQVLATVCSSFSASLLAQPCISYNGRAFVSEVLGKKVVKLREVRQVLKSLDKLKSSEMNIIRKNAKGQVESVGNFSFFDVMYGKNPSGDDSTYEFQVNNGTEATMQLDDEILSSDEWNINIFPTAFLKDTWTTTLNTEIYTKQYQKIVSPKAKSYMLLMQTERLLAYPEMHKFFSYAYLKGKLRLDNMKASYVKKEILELLRILQEENVVIASYDSSNTGVTVDFLPFTDLEMDLYKINQSKALTVEPSEVTITESDE